MKKKDEDIYLVKEKSNIDKKPFPFWFWQNWIEGKRVIPYKAKVADSGYTAVESKTRGVDAIDVHFNIDCGITLRYQGKEWKETAGVHLSIPFKKSKEISDDIQKILKKHKYHG